MADKVFELTVYEPLLYKSTDAYVFNCDSSITLVEENDSQEPTNVITGILLSVDVNKRVGTHNNIKVRLKIVQSTTNDEQKLNVTMLKNAFLGRKIRLDMIKDGKSYVIAENYYVFGVKPMKYKSDGTATYYVDLNIYSWDKLMDITKHSKSYVKKKLGGDILSGFMQSYKEKYAKLDLPECQTAGMRVMVSRPDDSSNDNENEEPAELAFPSMEQYNETDYNFLLRNANKCGEFFYFENGTLNLGLTRVMKETNGTKKEYVTRIDETSYASIESLSDEINDDVVLETFGKDASVFKLSENDTKPTQVDGESGTPLPPDKDTESNWDCVFAPQWSRVMAHVLQYTSIASFIWDTTEEEMSVEGYKKAKVKSFNKNVVDKYETTPQNGGGNSVNSNGEEANRIYAPDDNLFQTMDKAKHNVSDNQYRITFDDGQMNLKLGDLVSCSGIGNGERFVVVDVHSVFEKEDVIENPKSVNRMEVTVIPVCNDCPIPLPADADFKSSVNLQSRTNPNKGSMSNDGFTMRIATVEVSDDPYRLNQVQVKYDGDKEKSAEWIKVLTPFASNEKGISCKLNVGDKVVVLQNTSTKEQFVVGSYYTGENKPPCGQRRFSSIVRSKNGQYIGFVEGNQVSDILASFFPGFSMLKNIIPQIPSALPSREATGDTLYAVGGIEISDNFGLFTIAASSSQRNITISSPFGTVGIDAAMGITISAPNGNVKIVGKNVDIEAGNNLTLKSGTNIDSCLLTSAFSKGGSMANYISNELNSVSNIISGLFDFPTLRFVVELLFKPIAGTLKVHSGRNLLLEANGTETSILQPSLFDVTKHIDTKMLKSDGKEVEQSDMTNLVKAINTWISDFKTYKENIVEAYNDACRRRQDLRNKIMLNFVKKNENGGTILTDESLKATIEGWLLGSKDVTQDNVNDKFLFRPLFDSKKKNKQEKEQEKEQVCKDIVQTINDLRKASNCFREKNFKYTFNVPSFCEKNSLALSGYAQGTIKNLDSECFRMEKDALVHLFVESNEQKKQLRLGVIYIFESSGILKYDFYDRNRLGNDEKWIQIIESIRPINENTLETMGKNMAVDALNNAFPLDSLNTFCWDKEHRGRILMSQNSGSTLSINGQTLKEVESGVLEDVRKAMRNATL